MENTLRNESYFWRKKEFVSFILSILVLFIHISSIDQYVNSGTLISVVNEKFVYTARDTIGRMAVPMFFILSGITFFKGYDNKKYVKKIKSRVYTLVIPYVLWNTIWMIFEAVCSYSFLSQYFVGREPFVLSASNIIKGIFFHGYNGPFWFVFNLIVFSLAAPLIYCLIRNKYIGIVSVALLTVLGCFGIRIPSEVFFDPTSIVFYMIGAIIGKHYFGFTIKEPKKVVKYGAVVFFVAYLIFSAVFYSQIVKLRFMFNVVFFTLTAVAMWNITDLFFEKLKPRKIYTRSFAIYAIHVNIVAIFVKLIVILLPKGEWMVIPNFILSALLTLVTINIICCFMEKFLPKPYAILMGNRTKA